MPIGSVQRTYGLSGSGIDVDSEVQKLMKAKRASYDSLWQKKTQMEWQKTAYNTIYNLTNDFRTNTLANFNKSANLAPKLVTSTNDAVVSATANADAGNVSHTIAVTQLASGVTLASSNKVSSGSTTGSLIDQFGMHAGDNIDFTINGKRIQLTVNAAVTDASGKVTTKATTMGDVVSAINNSGAGVKAAYDTDVDRFFLYSNDIGSSSKIDFTGTAAGSFLDNQLKLAITNPSPDPLDQAPNPVNTMTFRGKDAKVTLDGVDLVESKNTFSVANVTYTIKAQSALDLVNKPIASTITVAPDVEKTIANVKAFVDDYNTYLAAVNKEYSADYDRNYMPLTDDQKSSMKDADITAWQAKAKTGLLHRDSILGNIVDGMRAAFSTPITGISGKYNNAATIGVSTGSYVSSDGTFNTTEMDNGGKLYVNEDTLRDVLQGNASKGIVADPDAVYKIFGNPNNTATGGIANQMYNQLYDRLKDLQNKAGLPDSTDVTSTLYKNLKDYNSRLDNMQTILKSQEDAYYAQFNAMEEAMTKMNQQSSWLSQLSK